MPDQENTLEWRETASTVLRAIVVVTCYLIVFAGLLLSVAGAGQ